MADSAFIPKYTILPKQCIDLWLESVGIPKLNDEVSEGLAEDVSFRIRECVHNALRIMKHCRRKCLTTDDFNNALEESNTEIIYGHGGIENLGFKSVSFKDGRLCYIEEKEVNLRELALESTTPIDPGEVSVKANWLVLEGHQCTSKKHNDSKTMLKEPISSYLTNVTSALIGKSSHLRKIVLKDLMVNKKLQVVLPYLVSFFSNQIKHHTGQDSFTMVASYILLSINALVENQSILLVPYVFQLVKIMLFIVTEAQIPVSKWLIKDKAAHVLAHLCKKQNLHNQLLKSYQDSLNDKSRALSYIYGAVVGVRILGVEAIANVLYPIMKEKLQIFSEKCTVAECETEITELAALRTAFARAASLLFSQKISVDLHTKYNLKDGISYIELYEELGEEFLIYCGKSNHECSMSSGSKLGSLQKNSNPLHLNKSNTFVTQLINNKLQVLKASYQMKPVTTEGYVTSKIIINDMVSLLKSKKRKLREPSHVFHSDDDSMESDIVSKKRKTLGESRQLDKKSKGVHHSYKRKHNHRKDISRISNILPIL